MKRILCLVICIALFSPALSFAKRKKSAKVDNPRLSTMSPEDKELFNALTKDQKKDLENQKIKTGYNEWMVTMALGAPYYKSEHHPVYKDYEQVWLYVEEQVTTKNFENEIIDPQTNWPTVHKKKWKKTCKVGDFFVLFDRGVVKKIVPDKSKKVYGSCQIRTSEEYIPIVDRKGR